MSDTFRFHDQSLRALVGENVAGFERRAIESSSARPAAVALALVPDEEGRACFLLTRRGARLRRHRGQWALPGGRLDDGETVVQAALRELHEEVGLELDEASVLGLLDDYATRSGFVITPIVTWCDEYRELRPDPAEVAGVYRVPLQDLDREDVPLLTHIPESEHPVLSMPILDQRIHAPTAAILYQLLEVCLRGRPIRVAHYEQPVFAWR